MTEFWESNFIEKREMWGYTPTYSSQKALNIFIAHGAQHILVPGIGYGRNAKVFLDVGMRVTGIEISKTAIEMAKSLSDPSLRIHHGSVKNMPFDDQQYDGVYCHALIHLLSTKDRIQLIQRCYDQLKDSSYMIFTAISQSAPNYGKGIKIEDHRYEFHKGVPIYFYDIPQIEKEFASYGLVEAVEIKEDQPMYWILCKKE